jgi:4-oxalocrotonate tautomerase
MPVVIVEMWEGRTHEQKKKLAKGITDAFVQIGVPASAVNIILKDNPKSCWAQGGTLCSETDSTPKT